MCPQILKGKCILDNGAANSLRSKRSMFKSLSMRKDVVLTGVGGTVPGHPEMGVIIEDGEELSEVVFSPLEYDIDSEHQVTVTLGYEEDPVVHDKENKRRLKRFYKIMKDGSIKEKIYVKGDGDTHYVRIDSLNVEDKFIIKLLRKMSKIHKNMGHLHPDRMIDLTDIYDESSTGYTKSDAKLYKKYGRCDGCDAGITTAVHANRNLVYAQYHSHYGKEGIAIDVFFVNKLYAFLIVRSFSHKMLWVYDVGLNYTAAIIRQCIEQVLGEYKYSQVEISFIRSDGDVRFSPLREWLQSLGIRYYMSPPQVHATFAEVIIRVIKALCRTIIFSLDFQMPEKYIPYIIKEAVRLITVRYDHKLGKTPRESFYKESFNYKRQFSFHFGEFVSYQLVESSSSILESRICYGVVLGTDVTTGNLIVENLSTQKEEKITHFKERIPIDESIRKYYKYYTQLKGFQYSKEHTIDIRNVLPCPVDPQEPSDTDQGCGFNNLEILCSLEYYLKCLDSSCSSDTQLAPAIHNIQNVEQGSALQDMDHELCTNSNLSLEMLFDELSNIDCYTDISNPDSTHVCNISTLPCRQHMPDSLIVDSLQRIGIEIEKDIAEEILGPMTDFSAQRLEIYNSNNHLTLTISVQQMSYDQMASIHPAETKAEIIREYKSVSDRDIIHGILKHEIPSDKHIGYCMTKFVEKTRHNVFERVRGRLLFGGNEYTEEYSVRWDEISSRTISTTSLYTILEIAAYLGMFTGTMDFKSAFLYARLPVRDHCYARLSKADSKVLVSTDPEKWMPFLNKDGHIYVKVTGCLYGHPYAARGWLDYLTDKLAKIKFFPLESDKCVFIRRHPDGTFDILGLHVDDIFWALLDPEFFIQMKQFLDDYFGGEGTMVAGAILDYLSLYLVFDRNDRSVSISQEHYWQKVIKKFELASDDSINCPHRSNFMELLRERGMSDDQITAEDDEQRRYFLSIIMSILWGALRTKPNILFNVTVLSTRAKYGTVQDFNDALNVLKYINSCKEDGIRLKIIGNIRIVVWVDSSANIHPDMRGQNGHVISIGDGGYGGPIEVSSCRCRYNANSTAIYELYALHNMLPSLEFLHEFLTELGFPMEPALVFVDNKAEIDIIRRGKISTGATRHIASKFYYAAHLIVRKIMIMRFCPSPLMIADILTKALDFPTFSKQTKRLCNFHDQHESMSDEIYKRLIQDNIQLTDDEAKAVELVTIILDSLLVQSQSTF